MHFDKFRISAIPFIHDAHCRCGTTLKQVSNGFLSVAMYCPKCEAVYALRLIRVPKKQIGKKFLAQARREARE